MKAKVIMVRHGSTKLNGDNGTVDKIRGWKDVPLSSKGEKEAEEASEKLQKKYKIAYMYSSDLSRALDTAKTCNVNKVPLVVTEDLRPWNLGIYQGQVTRDILQDLEARVRDEDKPVRNGETFRTFKERLLPTLQEIIEHAIKDSIQIAVFTHYRDLKCADAWDAAGFPEDYSIDVKTMLKDDFKPGDVYELPLERYLKR